MISNPWITEYVAGSDYLVPVPLHVVRKRERGYNQSQVLVRELCYSLNINQLPSGLVRTRNTRSQTELTWEERLDNVRNAFTLKNIEEFSDKIKDKTVLLVDDVFTTGATLDTCAGVLMSGGVKEVHCLTVARAEIALKV
jgi:ComF family protein